ncbi:DUF192 domain-containing protein [Chenggangzhangella methanolivorans]|uniref:DUF192 domain-containing protein n=1 Tax=Chenggangzhangella methanolivorans TaxID=1437009 RepID=A0A9E6RCH0_9HYPH|nr:DUF192 domain-containing protein [Chenggangzhangella methanolivorans]QZO00703.1 DUF192 domain-containing protein [Chenggangzhangella methanolivorans]
MRAAAVASLTLARLAAFAVVMTVALVSAALAAAKLEPLTFETAGGAKTFQIEVADTPKQREVGLMYRRSLPEDHGMLFDFGQPQEISMWMQNTYVSLDMVFVGADGRVLRVAEDTEPLSTRIVSSQGPARYVVELLAGSAKRIGLKPGDRVVHPRIGA